MNQNREVVPNLEKPFYLYCGEDDCGHEWVLCYLPKTIDLFDKFVRVAMCPRCAGKDIKIGKKKVAG